MRTPACTFNHEAYAYLNFQSKRTDLSHPPIGVGGLIAGNMSPDGKYCQHVVVQVPVYAPTTSHTIGATNEAPPKVIKKFKLRNLLKELTIWTSKAKPPKV